MAVLSGSAQCVHAPEEGHGGPADERAVRDLALDGEVLGGVDGRGHALDGEEGGLIIVQLLVEYLIGEAVFSRTQSILDSYQVSGVRRDEDGREEPPDARDDARRRRLRVQVGTAASQEVGIQPLRGHQEA